jgi:Spy/CpxP family protein refolding chaperone
MKVHYYVAGLLAASSVALALPAEAHRMGPGSGAQHEMQGRPGGGMRMLRQLDLTQEQRDQARKIFDEQAPALRERGAAARAAHDALRKGTLDPNADSSRIRELADAVGKAHADAAVLRAETMRRVAALLTPEQRAKLEQARERDGRGRRR